METSPHLNALAGNAQFQVRLAGRPVTAFISESSWRARFGDGCSDSGFLETLVANEALLDAAVARRVAAGARQPVVLRSTDL
ncbi:MAG: hypothetical protein JSR59_16785 [Proteobacteria bacterium]|nr:hypothetical protein [Pseudomonadota bacterium]